ncbi:MAG: hypothetical protein MHPSP_004494, partial [Paramarteilia canceri]
MIQTGLSGSLCRYGVSEPISLAFPTEGDVALSEELEEFLRANDCYESEEGVQKRLDVLSHISRLFKDWIKTCTIQK